MKSKILISAFLFFIGNNLYSQEKTYPSTITTSKFDFTINPWVNMHHFLYQESYLRVNNKSSIITEEFLQKLSSEELVLLNSTIAFYKDEILAKHFFYSDYMATVLNYLTNSKENLKIPENKEITPLVYKLKNFQPIYRKYFWQQHYEQNIKVLDKNLELIKILETPISSRLSSLFKNKWQEKKINVDISVYGALIPTSLKNVPYTNLKPTHIIMISSNYLIEENELWLELLFHEASHHLVFYNEGFIANTIHKVSKELNVEPTRGLWHAYLFYIAGKVTQEELENHSASLDQIYIEKFGVFSEVYSSLKRLDQYILGKKSLKVVTQEILKEINNASVQQGIKQH